MAGNESRRIARYRWAFVAALLLVLGARLCLVHAFGARIPFGDEWDTPAFNPLALWWNGDLTWSRLFEPHNEHRMVFTRLLTLVLVRLNDEQWDPLTGLAFNAFLATASAVVLAVHCHVFLGRKPTAAALPIFAALWIAPYAWVNTLMGIQSSVYVMILLTVFVLGALLRKPFTAVWWTGVVAAPCLQFTTGSGILILPVIGVVKSYAIAVDRARWRLHLPTLVVCAVVTLAALPLIVQLPRNEYLRATGIADFLATFGRALAWPWTGRVPGLALLTYLPYAILVCRAVVRRDRAPATLFVLALGGWVISQAGAMGYARGAGGVGPLSRYMDTLAIGAAANTLALMLLWTTLAGAGNRLHRLGRLGCAAWLVALIVGLGVLTDKSWEELEDKRIQSHAQIDIVREFLRTNDISDLTGKPPRHVPSPDPEWLAKRLREPAIADLLPWSVKPASPISPTPDDFGRGFGRDGFDPAVGDYLGESTVGSYGSSGGGQYLSELMTVSETFLEVPVVGDLGRPDLTLTVVDEEQNVLVRITLDELPGSTWRQCYVRAPNQPFRLLAEDWNPDYWFAFARPRGVGRLSMWTIDVLQNAWLLIAAGLAILGATAWSCTRGTPVLTGAAVRPPP